GRLGARLVHELAVQAHAQHDWTCRAARGPNRLAGEPATRRNAALELLRESAPHADAGVELAAEAHLPDTVGGPAPALHALRENHPVLGLAALEPQDDAAVLETEVAGLELAP